MRKNGSRAPNSLLAWALNSSGGLGSRTTLPEHCKSLILQELV